MTIGSFSMVTGLSITTLRHYDEIGLLPPAQVDPESAYRRYEATQVEVGRRVRLLRAAGLSTDEMAQVLGHDEQQARAVLADYRSALDQRSSHIHALLDELARDSDEKGASMKAAVGFRLVAVNIGVESDTALEIARVFWGEVLETELEDWGTGSRQVVLGEGDNIGFLNIRVRSAEEPHRGDVAAFGLGVPGLEATHRRALAAGAKELYPPTDGDAMPRHSLIVDPVGNRVVLWESGM